MTTCEPIDKIEKQVLFHTPIILYHIAQTAAGKFGSQILNIGLAVEVAFNCRSRCGIRILILCATFEKSGTFSAIDSLARIATLGKTQTLLLDKCFMILRKRESSGQSQRTKPGV